MESTSPADESPPGPVAPQKPLTFVQHIYTAEKPYTIEGQIVTVNRPVIPPVSKEPSRPVPVAPIVPKPVVPVAPLHPQPFIPIVPVNPQPVRPVVNLIPVAAKPQQPVRPVIPPHPDRPLIPIAPIVPAPQPYQPTVPAFPQVGPSTVRPPFGGDGNKIRVSTPAPGYLPSRTDPKPPQAYYPF